MQSKGQETYSHILKKSRNLFTVQGFQNTSISQVIAATDVKKGNLYYHFPSKEALGLAVLVDAKEEFFTILEDSLSGDNPMLKILNSCNTILAMMQQTNFVGGCLFGNTALEMAGSNSSFSEVIQEVFSHWTELIEQELLQAAKYDLPLPPISPDALATSVVAILEGGIMLSKVYTTSKSLEDCIFVIRTLLLLQR